MHQASGIPPAGVDGDGSSNLALRGLSVWNRRVWGVGVSVSRCGVSWCLVVRKEKGLGVKLLPSRRGPCGSWWCGRKEKELGVRVLPPPSVELVVSRGAQKTRS